MNGSSCGRSSRTRNCFSPALAVRLVGPGGRLLGGRGHRVGRPFGRGVRELTGYVVGNDTSFSVRRRRWPIQGSRRAGRARAKLAESLGYSTFLASRPPGRSARAAANADRGRQVHDPPADRDVCLEQRLAAPGRAGPGARVARSCSAAGGLEIGLGAGWNIEEYRAAGLSLTTATGCASNAWPSRLPSSRDSSLTGRSRFVGRRTTRSASMDGVPKPLQRPHPPFHDRRRRPSGMLSSPRARRRSSAWRRAYRGRQGRTAEPARRGDGREDRLGARPAAGERFGELELNTYASLGVAQVTEMRAAPRARSPNGCRSATGPRSPRTKCSNRRTPSTARSTS